MYTLTDKGPKRIDELEERLKKSRDNDQQDCCQHM